MGKSNLAACKIQDNGMPTDWTLASFDDSSWVSATEYTPAVAGWGRGPSYSGGQCGTITSPLTKENASPSSIATTADECLDPKKVLCGGDEDCTGSSDGRMIWGASLDYDNKMLFRYTATSATASNPAPVPVPTPSPMPAPASTNTPVPAPQSTPTSTDGAQVMWRLDLAWVAAIGSVLHLSLCNL